MCHTRTLERGVIIVIIVKGRWYPPVIFCRQKKSCSFPLVVGTVWLCIPAFSVLVMDSNIAEASLGDKQLQPIKLPLQMIELAPVTSAEEGALLFHLQSRLEAPFSGIVSH